MHLILTPCYPPNRIGGIDKVVSSLAICFNKNKEEQIIISYGEKTQNINSYKCTYTGFKVYLLPIDKNISENILQDNQIRHLKYLEKMIDFSKLKIVFNHDWFLTDLSIAISKKYNLQLITFIHSVKREEYKNNILDWRRNKIHLAQNRIIKSSDKIICLSENIENSLKNHFKIFENVYRINCGMDDLIITNYHTKKEFTYYYCGRFSNEKNLIFLIKSFIKSGINAKLILRGKGYLKANIQSLIDKNKTKNILLLPWSSSRNDIINDLKTANVFVCSSTYEPLGLNIFDAISCGIPVIFPNKYGPKEIYNNIQAGWLFNLNSSNSLQNAFITSFNNSDIERKNTIKNRVSLYKKYNWNNGYKQLKKII